MTLHVLTAAKDTSRHCVGTQHFGRFRSEADIDRQANRLDQAMFETAAEVLGGLAKAFHDYQQKTEKAWQR